ncbi:hypothetical protein BaRGS_00010522 [Batillaria attramentaria]|uniref:Uncharacterized protein n=1 Tax=Batillaria attramentaria TaxID=370345 RepID=A0ABD0LG15_9CAEN
MPFPGPQLIVEQVMIIPEFHRPDFVRDSGFPSQCQDALWVINGSSYFVVVGVAPRCSKCGLRAEIYGTGQRNCRTSPPGTSNQAAILEDPSQNGLEFVDNRKELSAGKTGRSSEEPIEDFAFTVRAEKPLEESPTEAAHRPSASGRKTQGFLFVYRSSI